MNKLDISALVDIDNQYRELVDRLNERFHCNWDDAIHDSYGQYVKQMQEKTDAVHEIRVNAESLVKEIEDLRVDDLSGKADSLCGEADAV